MDTPPKMEAGAAANATTAASDARAPSVRQRQHPSPPVAKDPFRLGFRHRMTTTPDGREVLKQSPLTYEDLVYPQEGDHVSQGLPHYCFLHPWADSMRRYLEKRPSLVVTSDVTLVLRHDGKNCAPDVAVIEGDFDPSTIKSGINLQSVGARLVFAFEAVSTSAKAIENKDLKANKKRYAAEGVENYFTIYPKSGRKASNLVGWRLVAGGQYVLIPPDAEGRVYSKKLGLLFSIDTATEKLVIVDATTGERLRVSDEEEAERVEAERLLAKETASRRQEAAAREKAEAEKRQETLAREKAEAEKRQEILAREKAEAEKRQEVLAREKVEQLNQEMMAELVQLRAQMHERGEEDT